MDYNIIIVITGMFTIFIALYILLRQKDHSFSQNHLSSLNPNEKDLKKLEALIGEGHLKLSHEIHKLTSEVALLREYITNLPDVKEKSIENCTVSTYEANDHEHFNHILNYNKFLQKNKDIIELYKETNNLEEIARKLNKSIREVEMVVKLVK
ncbi:hypothetical protein [Clostridium formicaceticum]|uniref:Uncharacterized protein n=1 Tax=Clostridium formicaceticum TaxID=1497 RepID=A0AAC9RLG9_9CLOT|nr:hypothetical protein [Clostridium formicaceticum]AOY77291.1 hypothetical protein BJL90_16410 [Clostridium formicaceticum]ARE87832.1 hypothetical protein CLFO_22320 [Clostridium formicaceticum]